MMHARNLHQPLFLPMTRTDMNELGWKEVDILLISGDAYMDHPAFGAALLGRWLTAHGFRVGIVAQPRWNGLDDVMRLGRPRLFAGISAGALDSMLAHYTAFRRKRRDDAYTPGGIAGSRPNRACIVYTNLIRRAFPGLPVVLGGIEASLRRVSHYDFWTNALRRSILLDAKADLILYGMAERAVLALARILDKDPDALTKDGPAQLASRLSGTVFACRKLELPKNTPRIALPSHEQILESPVKLVQTARLLEQQVHRGVEWAVQQCAKRLVVLTPPAAPLTSFEMDALYGLPFARKPHPAYDKPIPAMEMIAFSITTHRGCGGGCSFCFLALHQGRHVSSRGRASILAEAKQLTGLRDWKGSISDVGGPSANMWKAVCSKPDQDCTRDSCLHPSVCPFFDVDQQAMIGLLKEIRKLPKVRHVRVASGVRFDLLLKDQKSASELIRHFVGGQLKLAPEHCANTVLRLMRKPDFKAFENFLDFFENESAKAGKKQYVVPYLMSAFPGCTVKDMRKLAAWLESRGWRPRQVQCFVPTPGTMATAMYYAEVDATDKKLEVARTDAQRLEQHRILMPDAGKSCFYSRGMAGAKGTLGTI
ncbi:MAG TPA: YgiQ family radical SAM protein [Desulfonatronum sp.]|nr:YgiQ family radical SAM protein [Desulfonatronum sp.]